MVKVIESTAEFNELINSDKKVIVDFYADWCGYVFVCLHSNFYKVSDQVGGLAKR